jgi:hypothetical protein
MKGKGRVMDYPYLNLLEAYKSLREIFEDVIKVIPRKFVLMKAYVFIIFFKMHLYFKIS